MAFQALLPRSAELSFQQLVKAAQPLIVADVLNAPDAHTPCNGEIATDEASKVRAWLAWTYQETMRTLERYQRRVREGKELQAALEFGKYAQWSGLVPLMRYYAQDKPKIDGATLDQAAQDLQSAARDRMASSNLGVAWDQSQWEAVNRKLDLIAAQVGKLPKHG